MSIPAMIQANPLAWVLVAAGAVWLVSTYGPQWWAGIQAAASQTPASPPPEAALASVMEAYRVCHAAGLDEVCAHLLAAQSKIPAPGSPPKEQPHG